MRKTFRLFGIPVWSVETDDDEEWEEIELDPAPPALIQLVQDSLPVFGFVEHKDNYEGRNH